MISNILGNIACITGVSGMVVTGALGSSTVFPAIFAATAVGGAAANQAGGIFTDTKNHGVEVSQTDREFPSFGKVNTVSMNPQDVASLDELRHGLTVTKPNRSTDLGL